MAFLRPLALRREDHKIPTRVKEERKDSGSGAVPMSAFAVRKPSSVVRRQASTESVSAPIFPLKAFVMAFETISSDISIMRNWRARQKTVATVSDLSMPGTGRSRDIQPMKKSMIRDSLNLRRMFPVKEP